MENKQAILLPGRNTMDASVQVSEDWEKARDEKKTTYAVFFDFAKAFDLVDHKILLAKKDKMLPSWLTSWIAQYLSGRKQRVKCNNKHSEWLICYSKCNTRECSRSSTNPHLYFRYERIPTNNSKTNQILR
jgi:hypothetical protein